MNLAVRRPPWRPALGAVGLLALWRAAAPSRLGGSLTYVTVRGTSMLPGIRTGDLVVVAGSDDYAIGDVVAYRSPVSPAPVLHRIVERVGDRLLLKGDNNGFVDAYRPARDEVIGRELLRIPNGMEALQLAAHPVVVVAAALAAALCILAVALAGPPRRHRVRPDRRRTHPAPGGAAARRRLVPALPAARAGSATPAGGGNVMSGRRSRVCGRIATVRVPGRPMVWLTLAAVCAAVTHLAWTTPAYAESPATRPVLVSYDWDYRAALPPNDVYDAGGLAYGDTVFLSVVEEVDVAVAWDLADPDVTVASGDLALRAVLSSTAGWQRELATEPAVALGGGDERAAMALNFREALAVARTVDRSTGVSGRLTLDVLAEADLRGVVGHGSGTGVPFTGSSSSVLSFALTTNTATLVTTGPATTADDPPLAASPTGRNGSGAVVAADASVLSGSGPTGAEGDEPADGSTVDVVDWVRTPQQAPNRLEIGPGAVDVTTARTWSTLALLACSGLGLAGLSSMHLARRRGEAAVIAARHGAQLVPVRTPPDVTHADVVAVESFDALLRVGRELERPVMVLAGPYRDAPETHYFVHDGTTVYHYATVADAPAAAGTRAVAVDPAGTPTAPTAPAAPAATIAAVSDRRV